MAIDPATGLFTPEDDSVSTRLTGLLKQNSPIMQQAKTTGLQIGNKRGLLNSSMAVGAAQNEMIKAALPIASQDASQTASKNLSAQGFAQSTGLQQQQIDSTTGLQAADIAARKELQVEDLGSKERIATLNVGANDRRFAISAAAELNKKYGAMFTEIIKNNDIPADARENYFAHIAALNDSDLALVEQLYLIDLDWASPTVSANAPPAP